MKATLVASASASASASVLVLGVLAAPTAVADRRNCVPWGGNLAPVLNDAQQRVEGMSTKRLKRLFGVKKGGVESVYRGFANADPTRKNAKVTKGRQLGRVSVVWGIGFEKAGAYALILKYKKGCRTGIDVAFEPPLGSFGFPLQPKLELNEAVKAGRQFRKTHRGTIQGRARLVQAQLQRADAPPPLTKEKRYVLTYQRKGYLSQQLLVSMNGKVSVG